MKSATIIALQFAPPSGLFAGFGCTPNRILKSNDISKDTGLFVKWCVLKFEVTMSIQVLYYFMSMTLEHFLLSEETALKIAICANWLFTGLCNPVHNILDIKLIGSEF